MKPEPITAMRWAVVDLPTRLTPLVRLRWRTTTGDCASPELYRTRREARAVVDAHNAKAQAWGWRQRVARVRVTIEEILP